MDYLFEAVVILIAVLLPLSFFIMFIKVVIENLGDPHTVTSLEEAPKLD